MKSPRQHSDRRIQARHFTFEILEDRLVMTASVIEVPLDYEAWRELQFQLEDTQVVGTQDETVPAETQDAQSLGLIGQPQALQQYGYSGTGYTVAVIDTGIDYTHSALAGRVIGGYDFYNNDANYMDDNGHGTHVAGIIGSNNGTYSGVAPDVNLVGLKVLGANGSGSFGDVEDALQWVIANRTTYNIVSINMSLGAGNYSSNPFTFLEDEFAQLTNAGVFIAVASGNSFYSVNSQQGLGFPAVSSSVVAVGAVWDANVGSISWSSGAVDYTTAPDRITSFTQRSVGLDILAPGALITSTYVGGGFATLAGTSMASPVIAAGAALIHQALDATGQGQYAYQSYILNIMKQTGVTVIDGDDENDNVVNTFLSFQRLNLLASIESVIAAAEPAPTPQVAVLPFNDNFNRDNSNYAGSYWTQVSGDYNLQNNRLVSNSQYSSMAIVNGASATDVRVGRDFSYLNSFVGEVGVVLRQSENNMYLAIITHRGGTSNAEIWRSLSGAWTRLATVNVGNMLSGRLEFEAVGSTLSLFINGQVIVTASDATITSPGRVGLRDLGIGATVDNFTAATTPILGMVALPYADNFDRANSPYMGGAWRELGGDFYVQDNRLVSNAQYSSLAIVNGTSATDVRVGRDFSYSSNFVGEVGVVLRQSESNMYLAIITHRGGTSNAEIWRSLNGAWTRLASVNTGNMISGRLEFEAVGSTLSLFINGQVVVTASDATITGPGSVGLRDMGVGATVDNYTAVSTPSLGTATLPYADNFERADSPYMGGAWRKLGGDFYVQNNRLVSNAQYSSLAIVNGTSAIDVRVGRDFSYASDFVGEVGVVLRQSENNMYLAIITHRGGTSNAEIWRSLNGAWTRLASVNTGNMLSGRLEFEAIGSQLSLFVDGQVVVTASDATITRAGSVGLRDLGVGAIVDNYTAVSTPSLGTATLPYADNFDRADSPFMGEAWRELGGDFYVQNNRLVSNAQYSSLAIVNGTSATDVRVGRDFSYASDFVGEVGVVLRQSENSMYLAIITHRGGTSNAEIWRSLSGAWTRLASVSTGNMLSGRLEFEAIGSQLSLFVDGQVVVAAQDATINRAGSVGLRDLGVGASVDNFTATMTSTSSLRNAISPIVEAEAFAEFTQAVLSNSLPTHFENALLRILPAPSASDALVLDWDQDFVILTRPTLAALPSSPAMILATTETSLNLGKVVDAVFSADSSRKETKSPAEVPVRRSGAERQLAIPEFEELADWEWEVLAHREKIVDEMPLFI